jgi:AraC-like DNA-binding protein
MKSLLCLYKQFIELENHNIVIDTYADEYRQFFKQLYAMYGNGARGFVKKFFIRKKLTELHSDDWHYFTTYIKTQYNSGVGLKLLARQIGISYTKVRRLFQYLEIPIRPGQSVVTDHLRKVRKENAIAQGGWRNRKTKNKNTQRGVQGYFYNQSKKKYVWLRSTYEYIFAKWLDKNKIDWDVECQQWDVGGESYRPDFFIFEQSKLVKITEVKGYYKNRLWKFEELKKNTTLQNVEFSLIDDITPFLDGTTYLGELKWWKENRLLEVKL